MKKSTTIPTIKNFLDSMPSEGMDGLENQYRLYAALSYYFDGEDMKLAKVTAIKKKMLLIDNMAKLDELPEVIESDDKFGFIFNGEEYWLTVPSLNSMPKTNPNQSKKFTIEALKLLSDNHEKLMLLPYSLFAVVIETLGKSLGIG